MITWTFEGTFSRRMLEFIVENPVIKAYGQRGTDLKWRSYVEAPNELVEQMKAIMEAPKQATIVEIVRQRLADGRRISDIDVVALVAEIDRLNLIINDLRSRCIS